MTKKPRTWTLERWNNGLYEDYDLADGPSQLEEQERVWVIELEPVLDLLERLMAGKTVGHERLPNLDAIREATALLEEHGWPKPSSANTAG